MARSLLTIPSLTRLNYKATLPAMIQAERRQDELELKKHDKRDAVLNFERDEDGDEYLSLHLPGLPDGRPSVVEGNVVKVGSMIRTEKDSNKNY